MNQSHDASSHFIRIAGGLTVHYEESGNGTIPVIFIPGWTMSTKVFARQLAHYSGSPRYRAISYDPRGQGLTTKTLEGHSYQQHGRDLHGLIGALNLKGTVLVGWSYGALDAMAYLDQYGSNNVRALVILDGTAKPSGSDPTKEWVETNENRRWGTITPIEDRSAFNRVLAEWMLEEATPEHVMWVMDISSQTSGTVCALLNAAAYCADYEALLIEITKKLPVLVFAREDWRHQVSGWLKANAPAVPLVVMGKHLMFWERAAAFNAELDRFLEAFE
jgi:non-heme chloroperoxidase